MAPKYLQGHVHVGQSVLLRLGLPGDQLGTDLRPDLGPTQAVDATFEALDADLDLLAFHIHAAEKGVDPIPQPILGDLDPGTTVDETSQDRTTHHNHCNTSHGETPHKRGDTGDRRPLLAA
jgi:hypothetical protein